MVKACITTDGYLKVFRGAKWIDAKCPRVNGDCCGGWCPLFGEVFEKEIITKDAKDNPLKSYVGDVLSICEGVEFEVPQ